MPKTYFERKIVWLVDLSSWFRCLKKFILWLHNFVLCPIIVFTWSTSTQLLMNSTIYNTGNLNSTLFSFLNPFHFFQFSSHSLKISTLLWSTCLLSELRDLPKAIGSISCSSSRDSFVLGDLQLRRNIQPRIKCSIGPTYTESLYSSSFIFAFLIASMILVTFS